MIAMTSQITGISIICLAVCWGADQRKHQSSASLAFVRGIQRWSVDSPYKGPVTWKMSPFDDVIMAFFKKIPSSARFLSPRFSCFRDNFFLTHCVLGAHISINKSIRSSFIQVTVWHKFVAKPFLELVRIYSQLDLQNQTLMIFVWKSMQF